MDSKSLSRVAGWTFCVISLLGGPWPANGAAKEPPGAPAPQEQSPLEKVISIEMKEPTLASYVELLASKCGANVIIPEKAKKFPLPPISLKSIRIDRALELIPTLATGNYPGVLQAEVSISSDLGETILFTLAMDVVAPKETVQVHVFSIRELMDDPQESQTVVDPQTILTAIDQVLAMEGSKPEETQIKFHKDSGLIIAKASPSCIGLISTVIQQMRRDVMDKRSLIHQMKRSAVQTGGEKPAADAPKDVK